MNRCVVFGMKLGLPLWQAVTLARLNTPERIQDFINKIPINFEPGGDTCLSVTEALKQRRAHCIEAAFIAACAFWLNGKPPLLMDFQARGDSDHVVALFRHGKHWGAISKSNHVWLRWRDPIYRNLRELAMSYYHEYVTDRSKTLWTYSVPFDLRRFDPSMWVTNKDHCWDIAEALDETRHYKLVTLSQIKRIRDRDDIEVRAGYLHDYKPPRKKSVKRR